MHFSFAKAADFMVEHEYRVGRHVSTAGGISNSFINAESVGCNTMQIFISSPRIWDVPDINAAGIELFRSSASEHDIIPVFVHMPYLPNLASPDSNIYKKSVDALIKISKLCDELGIGYLITHLGSHKGNGKEKGIRNVINAISTAIQATEHVNILMEDQAGHANSVGADIDDIKDIYSGIRSKRVGICLDTCHLFAAGYDIRDHKVLDKMDRTLGFVNVKCLHLNDSLSGLGSFKDRHERIGSGAIGMDGFKDFFSYGKLRGIPIIMETAQPSSTAEAKEITTVRKLIG